MSVWEVVIKHGVNPGNLPIDGERFASLCRSFGAVELPLAATQTALLPRVLATDHKDPFDNMLLCQAVVKGLMFMTCDKVLVEYGLPMVVDGRA